METKRKKPNRLSETKRRDILGEIARGEITAKQASKKYNVAPSAVYRWQREWGFKSKDKDKAKGEAPVPATVIEESTQEAIPVGSDLRNLPHTSETSMQILFERKLYELRINQLEMENQRLATLVVSLTESIGDSVTHED
jgi:transposase-like protein